jgi:hypothetical protein
MIGRETAVEFLPLRRALRRGGNREPTLLDTAGLDTMTIVASVRGKRAAHTLCVFSRGAEATFFCLKSPAHRDLKAGRSLKPVLVRLQVCQVREVEVLFRYALSGL